SRSDLIASLVVLLLVPLALVWQQYAPILGDAKGAVPILEPSLWSFWLPYLIVLMVLSAGFAVLLYRTGRWTWPLVALNAALGLAVTIPFAVLIWQGELLNPAFVGALGWSETFEMGGPGAVIAAISLGVILLWSIGDSMWKLVAANRLS